MPKSSHADEALASLLNLNDPYQHAACGRALASRHALVIRDRLRDQRGLSKRLEQRLDARPETLAQPARLDRLTRD